MKGSGIANFKRDLLILTGHFHVRANLLDIQTEKGGIIWKFGGGKGERTKLAIEI